MGNVTGIGGRLSMRAAMALGGWGLLGHALSAEAACRGGSYGRTEFTLSAPARLFSRDVAINGALSPWLDTYRSYSDPYDIICDREEIEFGATGSAGAVGTYVESGITYSVYATAAPGVGVAVRARPISHPGTSGGFRAGAPQALLRGSGYQDMRTATQLKFIKTAAVVAGGRMARFQIGTFYALWGTRSVSKSAFIEAGTLTVLDQPLCRLQGRSVNMGEYEAGQFSGIGSVTTAIPYTVNLNCDAGVGRVQYQLNSGTPVFDEAQGVANVTGSASGIGIQYLDDKDAPLAFYKTHDFGDVGTGESSRLFKARYRQIAEVVGPGEANASLTFVFTYP